MNDRREGEAPAEAEPAPPPQVPRNVFAEVQWLRAAFVLTALATAGVLVAAAVWSAIRPG